jgi:hypothetical protein
VCPQSLNVQFSQRAISHQLPHTVAHLALVLQILGIVPHLIQFNAQLQNQSVVTLQLVLIVLRRLPLVSLQLLKSTLIHKLMLILSMQTHVLVAKLIVVLNPASLPVLVLILQHSVLQKRAHRLSHSCVLMVLAHYHKKHAQLQTVAHGIKPSVALVWGLVFHVFTNVQRKHVLHKVLLVAQMVLVKALRHYVKQHLVALQLKLVALMALVLMTHHFVALKLTTNTQTPVLLVLHTVVGLVYALRVHRNVSPLHLIVVPTLLRQLCVLMGHVAYPLNFVH